MRHVVGRSTGSTPRRQQTGTEIKSRRSDRRTRHRRRQSDGQESYRGGKESGGGRSGIES